MTALVMGTIRISVAASNDPEGVLATLHAVADWQLKADTKPRYTDWIHGVGYTGFMALSRLPGGKPYEEAMIRVGTQTGWTLGRNCRFHADDQCIGQLYLDLYALKHDPVMIAEVRQVMDAFCGRKNAGGSMAHGGKNSNQRWTWCDALFMAPPVLAKLYAITGDAKYHDTLVKDHKRTSDFLYDAEEHLYFRDQTYFQKREVNGRKVFWSRGNGWVFGGLALVLSSLPKEAPSRSEFERQYKELAERIMTLQQLDGLWRVSLLDPQSYPDKEVSGSALFCFGLAWGVNNGLLEREATLPAIDKAWSAMSASVQPDGKLIHVQPVGEGPKAFPANSTAVYGVGTFLLAGSEVYRLHQPSVPKPAAARAVTVENDATVSRLAETIELP